MIFHLLWTSGNLRSIFRMWRSSMKHWKGESLRDTMSCRDLCWSLHSPPPVPLLLFFFWILWDCCLDWFPFFSSLFQFASVEVIVTTIQDHFEHHVRKYFKRKEILVAVVCAISFLFGLPNITQVLQELFSLIIYIIRSNCGCVVAPLWLAMNLLL